MRIVYTLLLAFASTLATAQQEAILSQFFYNKTLSNPAAAGTGGYPCLTAFYRQQWAGLEGAPSTQVLSFHTPVFADRVGVGLTLMNDRTGFFNSTFINAAYAYRVTFGSGKLAIGMQGSYLHHRVDWDQAQTISGTKPLAGEAAVTPVFNFGAGVHFENERFFLSASVPNILEKGLRNGNEGIVGDLTGTVPHLFISAGGLVPISDKVTMRPAFATRFAKNAPASTDVHVSFGFLKNNKLWLGGTYRWSLSKVPSVGDALVAMAQYQIGSRMKAGMAYDFSLNNLQGQAVGTYELLLEYCFVKQALEVKHPRFF
ncbi:MAG: type IX secretion system membrane protein PorP/SprF [Saprospiraceae bacterium]